MPAQTVFSAQLFEKRGKKLAAGNPLPFKSAEAARGRAERARDRFNDRTVGAVAIEQTVDTETGEILADPIVLARFGELPRELSGEE